MQTKADLNSKQQNLSISLKNLEIPAKNNTAEQLFSGICNLTKNTVINFSSFNKAEKESHDFSSYDEGCSFFLSRITNPEEKKRLKEFTDRGNLTSNFLQGTTRSKILFQQIFNGKLQWLELSIFLLKQPGSDDILAFVILATTEEKNQAKLFTQPKSANTKKNRKNFLSHISHSSRTELNSILGILNIAKEQNNSPDEIRKYLNQIDNSCKVLASIFTDLFDIVQVKSDLFVLSPEPYQFEEFSNYVLNQIASYYIEKNIVFRYDPNNFFPALMLDKQRFNQIFYNMFYGLMKHVKNGEHISFSIEDKKVQNNLFIADFVVSTNSSVFTDEQNEIIQELFAKNDLSDIYSSQIVDIEFLLLKTYVFLLNGKIKFIREKKAKLNKFVISLSIPIAKRITQTESDKKNFAENFSSLTGKKVLLVEDNYLNREICLRQLENKKIDVVQAVDGLEALNIFKKSEPGTFNAILMDIQMPVMNGYEATKAIRSLDRADALTTPIIAMSADGLLGNIQKSLSIGMVAHLTKPISLDKLYGTLAAFCTN